jgi:hypothetical protein
MEKESLHWNSLSAGKEEVPALAYPPKGPGPRAGALFFWFAFVPAPRLCHHAGDAGSSVYQ